jgi:predicted transcriptional regulator of viral defense system
MGRSSREAARRLASLATDQGGYFTAKQAKGAGYEYPHLEYHVARGNFGRVEHGLYRLLSVPQGEHDELIRLTLWSRSQQDEPQAVVSHESALVLHDLTDLLPDRVHLTVPPKFRKVSPRGCVLHKAVLDPAEVEDRAGFRVTAPLRTLTDATAGGISQEELGRAVRSALSRGLVRRTKLLEAVRQNPNLERLVAAVGTRKIARK